VLGGGSNVVVSDAGFDGLVLQIATKGRRLERRGGETLVEAAAGEVWDELVAHTVRESLAGLECLTGIPGSVGATPIQNVGAYGQEVADTIRAVRVLERATGAVRELTPDACAFGYRDSLFKHEPQRYVVLGVQFALRAGAPPALRYPELAAAVQARSDAGNVTSGVAPTLATVAATVRALRRQKSMVLDNPADPNRRSAGSFFMNPVLSAADADAVLARAVASGAARDAAAVPRFPAPGGRIKLSAAWLIERAGFPKGFRRGAVGISTRHALALVHHGGGSTTELLALASSIRAAVEACFGVTLTPEPVIVGE
jgi:UDP-N-acetylmuramate dehydrogenase